MDNSELLNKLIAGQERLRQATERSVCASLVGGLIAASGRAHSPREAASLLKTMLCAMYPASDAARYKQLQESGGLDRAHK